MSKAQAAAPPTDAAAADPVRRGDGLHRRAAGALRRPPRRAAGRPQGARQAESGFLEETAEIREGDWQVPPPRPDYEDRRAEITGPTDRKLVINALNSGAKGFMADFEDANSPTWQNQVEGHLNLIDAIEGTITYDCVRRQALRADRQPGDAARPPARLAPAREAHHDRRRARRGRVHGLRAVRVPLRPAARRARQGAVPVPAEDGAPPGGGALERRLHVHARGAVAAAGADPRHGADRDAPGRVPDGGDHPRAGRALLRAQRRPLGLHLLDDQGLPRRPGLRAARPQRREDDGPVHAGLHRAAGQDLPRARRVRDGRHGRADPLAQGPGGQPARAGRGQGRQGARGQGRLRRHLGRAPGRGRRRAEGVRRGARQPPEPDRQAALRRGRLTRAAARRVEHARRDHRGRACAATSASASSTSRSGSAAAAPPASTT